MNAQEVKDKFSVSLAEGSEVQVTWDGGNGPHWYHVTQSWGELYLLTAWELPRCRHSRRGFDGVAEVHATR